ncbi:hypothetical protein ONZ45_g19062 [Pleurotus djamor]|nr:hypothetical protein ONZ45_g19062 [Pleurotus djamor]
MSNTETTDALVTKLDDASRDQQAVPKAIPRAQFNEYINKLIPPQGTDYWRHQEITVFNNGQVVYSPSNSAPNVNPLYPHTGTQRSEVAMQYPTYEWITWRIDAYVYVTYAQPGDDFASQGGSVFVVLVHSGTTKTGSPVENTFEYCYDVGLQNPPNGALATKQLPPSNTGVQSSDGNLWSYPISFTQDMQMFKNNASDIFTFTAQYEDSVDFNDATQTGYVDGLSETKWSVVLNSAGNNANFPFGSLSVFTFSSLEEITFKCTASVKSGTTTNQTQSMNEGGGDVIMQPLGKT